MTLPDAYRGYAPITWDTRTLAALIASMGGVGAAAPPALAVADARYARSPLSYFCDVNMAGSPAGATKQTVLNATWATIRLDTKATDTSNSFNTSNWLYTVPATGIYFCQGLIRPNDGQVAKAGFPDGTGVAIGIGLNSDNDGTWVQWNKWMWMSGNGGGRVSWDYTRLCAFNQGDLVRLYMFSDLGGQFDLTRASMQIWRIG
jgi:hypothetical protein